MSKKEFVAVALDPEYETYIVYIELDSSVALPSFSLLNMHLLCRLYIAYLIAEKASTKVFTKYSDFADVLSPGLASNLSEHTKIYDHAIKMIDSQQALYRPIYSLELVKLESLKAYIATNLANKFIKPSKSPAGTLILFDQKLNISF